VPAEIAAVGAEALAAARRAAEARRPPPPERAPVWCGVLVSVAAYLVSSALGRALWRWLMSGPPRKRLPPL
jgi:hypothetical protein